MTIAKVHGWFQRARRRWRQRHALRIFYVANAPIPTLQLGFLQPLQPLEDADALVSELLTEFQVKDVFRKELHGEKARKWVARRVARFRPDVIVFCRYSGPHAGAVTDWARRKGVPVIFHLDDDLLNVPAELGPGKFAFHNAPERLATVRHLLASADLVFCSTQPLLERMRQYGIRGQSAVARVHCPGRVLRQAPEEGVVTIGYMGVDHAHDFGVALPALVRILQRHPHVRFEIFGPIHKPAELEAFGDRVTQVGFVQPYEEFLRALAARDWAVGICPLAETPFNHYKANNKWVEYTSAGIAVVATAGMLYDECCADGCGLLAADDAQWEAALELLVTDAARRRGVVEAAQARLQREYSMGAAREQLLELFRSVRTARAHAARHAAGAGAGLQQGTGTTE
jgi:glycosyltransferase involved in cell wall biosynthesis